MYRSRLAGLWLVIFTLGAVESSAAPRTWHAASGGFSTEAEFVELRPGDLVRLKRNDGSELDVPLDKLSAADQEFVRKTTASRSQPKRPAKTKSERLLALEKELDHCKTAEEGLRLCRVFVDAPETTQEDRDAIAERLQEFSELADKHLVRLRGKWVAQEEFLEVRQRANELMKQGIELRRLKQVDAFRKKFADAALLEPDSMRADFLAGIICGFFGLLDVDQAMAQQYFERCARREPDNVALLNNLALTDIKRGNVVAAVGHWRRAAQLGPDRALVQNVGRFIDQVGSRKIQAPKQVLDQANSLYASLLGNEKLGRANLKQGFFYELIDADSLSLELKNPKDKDPQNKAPSSVPPPAEDGSRVIGGGTGFVVAPHFILTNNHVIANGTSFELQTSDPMNPRLLRATLVAKSEKPDLALLQCDELEATPLALDPAVCARGTEIMTLGYPEMTVIGATLKATRGVISALPNPAIEDMYLYDATVNQGNSGGPVCDNHGSVVAVTTISVRTAVAYGGGIPSAAAIAFVQQHVPGFAPAPPAASAVGWTEVDRIAAPAVVLVWTRSKTGSPNSGGLQASYLEDPQCMVCNGIGLERCSAPGCVDGSVQTKSTSPVGPRIVTTPCPVCNGKGVVPCAICGGTGVDPQLARSEIPANPAPQPNPPQPNPQQPNPQQPNPQQPGRQPTPGSPFARGTYPGRMGPSGPGMQPGARPSVVGGVTRTPGYSSAGSNGFYYRWRRDELVELHNEELQGISEAEAKFLAKDLRSTKLDVAERAAEKLRTHAANGVQSMVSAALEFNLGRGDWSLQGRCCEALVHWGTDADGLVKALGCAPSLTRRVAIACLAKRGDDASIAALVQHLRKPREFSKKVKEFDVDSERNQTMNALIKIGAKAKPAVAALKDDSDPEARTAGEKVIAAIDAPPPMETAADPAAQPDAPGALPASPPGGAPATTPRSSPPR